MADQNKSSAQFNFCSEILSPSELFAARSRSHKIPVRGQKEFLPSNSQKQRERLQQSLDEHWDLVSEERVERLGNLVKAVWIPSDGIVELQSPAGKFWQTMGFSANGKQCLHPEEALYLMECGNLQVFYRELPLSIQEAYERFLSPSLSLQQYQVFGHLKRLGYVVNRFDASSVASQYERQLNLPVSHDRGGSLQKRKRSPSPSPRKTEAQEGSFPEGREEKKVRDDRERREEEMSKEREDRADREERSEGRTEEENENREKKEDEWEKERQRERRIEKERDDRKEDKREKQSEIRKDRNHDSPNDLTMTRQPGASVTEVGQGRNWWADEERMQLDPNQPQLPSQAPSQLQSLPQSPSQPQSHSHSQAPSHPSGRPRWDFSSISFPDLGSTRSFFSSLSSPDPSLLPGALAVGPCSVTPWLQRLNLRQIRMSHGERERERKRDRYRRDVNKDREVRRCQNWAEYHRLLTRRSGGSYRDRPAHLWEGRVTPLHDPRHHASTGELLEKISVIKPSRLTDRASREQGSGGWKLCFDVYQPDTVAEFKKSSPGRPYSRMCVCSFDGPVPDLGVVNRLSDQSGDVPVTFAVVDHGDISFYCFKHFQLPSDAAH